MTTTTFKPREHFPHKYNCANRNDTAWRQQLLRGDVHDPVQLCLRCGWTCWLCSAMRLQIPEATCTSNGGEMNGALFEKENDRQIHSYSSGYKPKRFQGYKPVITHPTDPSSCRKCFAPLTLVIQVLPATRVWVDPALHSMSTDNVVNSMVREIISCWKEMRRIQTYLWINGN